jgi:hypothetical protein
MTPDQIRAQARIQELTRKAESQTATEHPLSEGASATKRSRAEINRANAQKSTGPTTSAGEARSSRNSFKHGLYSKELVLPNENPAELDQLRASLRAEHQPINTTEEMLVNDLAENFWRLRRMREFETRAMLPENILNWHESGLLAVVQRTMASAERGFHKALTALRRLQKDRGFVPQNCAEPAETSTEHQCDSGFVPQEQPETGVRFLSLSPEEMQEMGECFDALLRPYEKPLSEVA